VNAISAISSGEYYDKIYEMDAQTSFTQVPTAFTGVQLSSEHSQSAIQPLTAQSSTSQSISSATLTASDNPL
jgi:hypothetical protein